MLLCFKIEVAQREFLEEGRPVFDLQLCIVLSFRRGSCHRKVSAGSLDADPVGSSWRYSLVHEINIFMFLA
jgi:hypothetical protein